MSYSEKNFLKLLDYEELDIQVFIEKMAEVLNLQYFKDDNTKIHTLAGTSFVIDFVEGGFKLIFVDEAWYSKFRYVEYFLNLSFASRNFVSFFNYLRYFSQFDKPNETYGTSLNQTNSICNCISSHRYCIYSNFSNTLSRYNDKNTVFNIFTHRTEYHFYSPFFIPIDKDLVLTLLRQYNMTNNLEDLGLDFEAFKCLIPPDFNLALLYDVFTFNISIFKYFLTFSTDCYFSSSFDDLKIEIRKDCRVIIEGVYSKKETFLFKKGVNLPIIFEVLK